MLAALQELPAEQRAALVLVDMEGYPVAEVAAMLDCAEGTVKSRCARGRAKLAVLLRPLLDDADESRAHTRRREPGRGPGRRIVVAPGTTRRSGRRSRLTQPSPARARTPMTSDEHDEQLDPLSPADEERISALLADARATEPMPADVVARLDQSLAGLAAERIAIDPVPADNVVPITRTRRHRVVAVLGAAAAVVVFGLAVGTFFDQSGGDGDSDRPAADSDVERGAATSDSAEQEVLPSEAAEPDDDATTRDGDDVIVADRAYVVRSRHLSADLARIQGLVLPDPERRRLLAVPSCRRPRASPARPPRGAGASWSRCGTTAHPAFVAFRGPMGDVQVVDVLQCGTGDLLRSTTLPTDG